MTPAPSAPRICGFRAAATGSPLRSQTSRWLSDAARSSTSTSPGAGHGIGHVLVAENLRAALLVDADRLHACRDRTLRRDFARPAVTMRTMTTADVQRLGAELGLDAVGVDAGRAYEGTERHIRERRARGLFGRLRFTTVAARDLLPSRARCSRARAASSRRRSATTSRSPSGPRATAGCRATPGTTATPSCARSSTRSAARSARPTACSSTRTSTSTARPPRAPASASTARTRC